MSYFHIAEENFPLAGFGCGADCPCTACRSTRLGLGERYITAERDIEQLRLPFPASPTAAYTAPPEAEQTAGWFGEAAPVQSVDEIDWCVMRQAIARLARVEERAWTRPDGQKFLEDN